MTNITSLFYKASRHAYPKCLNKNKKYAYNNLEVTNTLKRF